MTPKPIDPAGRSPGWVARKLVETHLQLDAIDREEAAFQQDIVRRRLLALQDFDRLSRAAKPLVDEKRTTRYILVTEVLSPVTGMTGHGRYEVAIRHELGEVISSIIELEDADELEWPEAPEEPVEPGLTGIVLVPGDTTHHDAARDFALVDVSEDGSDAVEFLMVPRQLDAPHANGSSTD